MKLKSLILALGAVVTLLCPSCMKFGDPVPMTYQQLCVTSYYGGEYLFVSDLGEKFVAKSLPAGYEFEDDKRVMVVFSQYTASESEGAFYDYLIVPKQVIDITTKDFIFINEENRDTIGEGGVIFNNIYAVGNYLNVGFTFGASGSKPHYFNMSIDADDQPQGDTIKLTFHHKDYDDMWTNNYNGFLSFDLRSLGVHAPLGPTVISIKGMKPNGANFSADIDFE